jgi:AraC-like DNA-binding protein
VQRLEYQRVLARALEALEKGRARVKVPPARALMQRHAGMHYHFRPELFVQLEGATRFRFPDGELMLLPGEVAVMPTGVPHGETALPAEGGESRPGMPFRNFVVGFYSSSVSMHLARDFGAGRPDIETISFFSTPDLRRIVEMVEFLAQAAHSGGPRHETTARGLALALFATLADLTHAETPDVRHESQRIFQIKWLVRDQLYNPELNVTFMAQRLGCSADYLSHVFHKETGETLIHYIHRQRMRGALEVIGNAALTVSEIAWACGFADAGYFTRVFRKHTGLTPQAYRKRLAEEPRREEELPKTIYHDRADYDAGRPRQESGVETAATL